MYEITSNDDDLWYYPTIDEVIIKLKYILHNVAQDPETKRYNTYTVSWVEDND